MSMSPLPTHMSCFGVSSDAVSIARGYSKSSYAERLSTVKSMHVPGSHESSVVANDQASGASEVGPHVPPKASSTRQAPQVKLQPLGPDQAQQLFGSGNGPAAGVHCTASPPSTSLLYRSNTKHVKNVAPTLQALDFISIAVNSVGGGGVPRPYGKFQACRAGDGNATWQRLPPSPGSWQARALPIAVTLLGDCPPPSTGSAPSRTGSSQSESRDGAATADTSVPPTSPTVAPGMAPQDSVSYSASYNNGLSSSGRSTSGGAGTSHGGVGGMCRRSRCRRGQLGHLAAGLGAGSGLHNTSNYRRPGSSLHRSLVPLPPPEPHNLAAWFALPAATFLSDVPKVPEQLRMDNGYSVSREFLKSGLHPPRRQPPPPPPSPHQSAPNNTRPQPGPGTVHGGGANGSGSNGGSGHLFGSLYGQSPLGLATAEDSPSVWTSLEVDMVAAAATAGQYGTTGGGTNTKLRGVYVPLEKRGPESLSAEAQLQSQSQFQLLPSGVGSSDGEPPPRRALHLPPEISLPRKNEPTGR